MLTIEKKDSSHHYVDGTVEEKLKLAEMITIEDPSKKFSPLVQAGIDDGLVRFFSVENNRMVVPNGLLKFTKKFGIHYTPEQLWSQEEIVTFMKKIMQVLPFSPYKHQAKAFVDSIINRQQINLICTGGGKSLTISMLCQFFYERNMKGVICVPSINLVEQFYNDIEEYNLKTLHNDIDLVGGDYSDKDMNKALTITTWQSLMSLKHKLKDIDYILVDECHRAKGNELNDIIEKCTNAKVKLGFTGTLNETAVDRMTLFASLGSPTRYMTLNGLVKLGLATPVKIVCEFLVYEDNIKRLYKKEKAYPARLSFIKELSIRTEIISKRIVEISKQRGNTIALFQHTTHGKELFRTIFKLRNPDVELENKHMTGKKAFEFQDKYGIYFMNGKVPAKDREKIRKLVEKRGTESITLEFGDIEITVNHSDDVILSCGKTIKAKDVTMEDDVSDAWIKEYK